MLALKKLRRRIRSVANTGQITRTMGMVSGAKLHRCESARRQQRPFYRELANVFRHLLSLPRPLVHPLCRGEEEGKVLLCLYTSDRGLCGAFNMNLIRFCESFLATKEADNVELFTIGRRGYNYFRRRGVHIAERLLELGGKVDYAGFSALKEQLLTMYLGGDYQKVLLLYPKFVSRGRQEPELSTLLPLSGEEVSEAGKDEAIDFILEPDVERITQRVLPLYFYARLVELLLESFCSEHSARMLAMNNATLNCEKLVKQLTLELNKARQTAITRELLDIVGGAEALRQKEMVR